MKKLIEIPNTALGVSVLDYFVPESISGARLISLAARFLNTAPINLDLVVQIRDKNNTVKGAYPAINIGGVHLAVSQLTWGGTGAYYVAQDVGGLDYYQIPMQALDLEGGDKFSFLGVADISSQWVNVALWVDVVLES